jgi:hypothetical protein
MSWTTGYLQGLVLHVDREPGTANRSGGETIYTLIMPPAKGDRPHSRLDSASHNDEHGATTDLLVTGSTCSTRAECARTGILLRDKQLPKQIPDFASSLTSRFRNTL